MGQRLLLAQRITVSQEGLHLLLHRLFRKAVAGVGRHGCRHVPDRLLKAEIVAGGIDLGMGHPRERLRRRLLRLQPLDLGVAAKALDGGLQRFGADQACRRIRRRFHHVRAPEHGFLPGQVNGQIVEAVGQLPDSFSPNLDPMARHGPDQRLALREAFGLFVPAPVTDLRIVVVRLAGPGDLVDAGHARGVAARRNAQLAGLGHDRLAPLRPEDLQVLRHALDTGECAIGTVLLHRHAEALAEVPGQGIAVNRARGLGPAVGRVLVHGPPLAVLAGAGRVEDDAVGVELRVVLPAGAVLEHRYWDIGGQDPYPPLPVTDPGIGAVAEHRLFQRHAGGVVVRVLDA